MCIRGTNTKIILPFTLCHSLSLFKIKYTLKKVKPDIGDLLYIIFQRPFHCFEVKSKIPYTIYEPKG